VEHIVSDMQLDADAAADVLAVYEMIAEAESAVHGVPVDEIHLHEVGTMDAVADVTAVCLLMRELSPDEVVASPIHVGSGTVKCAHGILPVPAPAATHILKGVPIYGGAIQSELCTPTGAALVKHFATRFGEMPLICHGAIIQRGCGRGIHCACGNEEEPARRASDRSLPRRAEIGRTQSVIPAYLNHRHPGIHAAPPCAGSAT